MPSLAARLLIGAMAAVAPPLADRLVTSDPGIRLTRSGLEVLARATSIGEPQLPRTAVETDRVRGDWLGERQPGRPVLYYIHGSGYSVCSPATHRGLVSELARRIDRPAFVVRYRMAPEHRFPAAQDDVLAGYLWLLDQGYEPADITVAGDSAGGHLALGLVGRLRAAQVGLPAAIAVFSPLVDPSFRLLRQRRRDGSDPVFSDAAARALPERHYLRGADLSDPRLDIASTLDADFPPVLIQAGSRDFMSGDAEHLADTLRAAGADCRYREWPGMFHVFQAGYRVLPEAREALDDTAAFIVENTRLRSTH